jgi:hypothetical protein
LPGGDFCHHGVGHAADEVRTDLDGVHLVQVGLDLAHRHASGVHRDDPVVEAPGMGGLVQPPPEAEANYYRQLRTAVAEPALN